MKRRKRSGKLKPRTSILAAAHKGAARDRRGPRSGLVTWDSDFLRWLRESAVSSESGGVSRGLAGRGD